MNVMKLALLGTAALAVASVSARADSLDALKASMDNLTIGAVADAPAAPTTLLVWDGRVRAAAGTVVTNFGATPAVAATGAGPVLLTPGTAAVAAGTSYATDIRANFHLGVTATTQTAVGEVGVAIAIQAGPNTNTAGVANGQGNTSGNAFGATNNYVQADGFAGWWKMTPTMTLKAGTLGIQKSSYSMDGMMRNWFFARSPTSLAYGANNDPAAFGLYYADGPLGFGVQAYDSDNANNVSAFGVNAKMSYKMDALGFDVYGDYAGRATGQASWAVGGGLGYSAGAFALGATLSTGNETVKSGGGAGVGYQTLGSLTAKANLSDVASFEVGVSRDFAGAGNPTTFGAGLYYTPVKQFTLGLEGSYVSSGLGAPGNDGSYSAGLVSAFTF